MAKRFEAEGMIEHGVFVGRSIRALRHSALTNFTPNLSQKKVRN